MQHRCLLALLSRMVEQDYDSEFSSSCKTSDDSPRCLHPFSTLNLGLLLQNNSKSSLDTHWVYVAGASLISPKPSAGYQEVLQSMGLLVVTLKTIAIRACLLRELIVCWNAMHVLLVYHFWLSKSHGWVCRWTPYSVTKCLICVIRVIREQQLHQHVAYCQSYAHKKGMSVLLESHTLHSALRRKDCYQM